MHHGQLKIGRNIRCIFG